MRLSVSLLRIDSVAGLSAGVIAVVFSAWMSDLYGVPREYVLVNATANLVYGTFSGWLASRSIRPMSLIVALAAANGTWAVLCVALAIWLSGTATVFGLAHLLFEATFVGGLAVLEWRYRDQLALRHPSIA